jgi:hypothetical protein
LVMKSQLVQLTTIYRQITLFLFYLPFCGGV